MEKFKTETGKLPMPCRKLVWVPGRGWRFLIRSAALIGVRRPMMLLPMVLLPMMLFAAHSHVALLQQSCAVTIVPSQLCAGTTV